MWYTQQSNIEAYLVMSTDSTKKSDIANLLSICSAFNVTLMLVYCYSVATLLPLHCHYIGIVT
jgi:hypothetical protein